MKRKETARVFLSRFGHDCSDVGQFNVYRVEEFCDTMPPNRRDFYKIALLTSGEGVLSYADKTIRIKDSNLFFTNPMIPYSWERASEKLTGYFCIFTESFITSQLKADSLAGSSLFKVGGNHVLFPDKSAMTFLAGIFDQMLTEIQSSYDYKYDLLRSYVQIIMHEALKIEPPRNDFHPGNSSARISTLFQELLERQFPIASPQHTLRLKNANEFADQLSVHTNHLNRALKEATGKTTTELIADRMVREAKALLLHSTWSVSEIGTCLGFGHSSNFNIFFKKQVGLTPSHFRRKPMAIS